MPDRRHTLSVLFREDSTLTPLRDEVRVSAPPHGPAIWAVRVLESIGVTSSGRMRPSRLRLVTGLPRSGLVQRTLCCSFPSFTPLRPAHWRPKWPKSNVWYPTEWQGSADKADVGIPASIRPMLA